MCIIPSHLHGSVCSGWYVCEVRGFVPGRVWCGGSAQHGKHGSIQELFMEIVIVSYQKEYSLMKLWRNLISGVLGL